MFRAMGGFSKALRRTGSRQLEDLRYRRPSTAFRRAALPGCHRLKPDSGRGARDRQPSGAQAPSVHASDRPGGAAVGSGSRPRSFHGRGLDNRRCRRPRLRKRRHRERPRVLSNRSQCDPTAGRASRRRKALSGSVTFAVCLQLVDPVLSESSQPGRSKRGSPRSQLAPRVPPKVGHRNPIQIDLGEG